MRIQGAETLFAIVPACNLGTVYHGGFELGNMSASPDGCVVFAFFYFHRLVSHSKAQPLWSEGLDLFWLRD